MKPNNATLFARVRRRFPDRSRQIARLLREDEEFAELCRDYEESSAALDAWRLEPHPGARQVERYTELVKELEQEIEGYLEPMAHPVSVKEDGT